MKKVFGLAVAGLALASVAAYAAQEHDAQNSENAASMQMRCDGTEGMGNRERRSDMRGHSGMRQDDLSTPRGHNGHSMMHGGMMGHGSNGHSTYPKGN